MTRLSSEPAGDTDTAMLPAVEFRQISKSFGTVTACDNVDLTLHAGQIHGILGENGAGKSTLMKILIGLVLPDGGSMRIAGVEQQIQSPQQAAALGIGMVHQHFSLVDALSVWENVALGESGRLDPDAVRSRIAEISEQYGLEIDPDARVGSLSAGLRQRVEIIKCLRRDPDIVIFDEPTSVLTPAESSRLFASFREVVASQRKAVVLISHKLDEVLAATDDITVMRHGRVVERIETASASAAGLARAMVGREVTFRSTGGDQISAAASPRREQSEHARAPAALELNRVTVRGPHRSVVLDDLSLEAFAGEILAIVGVEGNGQRAIGDLLSSLVAVEQGDVLVNGVSVTPNQPGAMGRAGIGVIAEDRHDSAVVLDMTVAENLMLVDPARFCRRGIVDWDLLTEHAQQLIAEFEIQCTGPDAPLWSLSGGNQQRVVLARELSANPRVLVAAQPTRGLDVGAAEYTIARLRQAADDGVAVVLISNELEDVLDLADRIAVVANGRVVTSMHRADVDLDKLGLLMGGATA